MKTMRQIAVTLGVSKQQVYRYIKKESIVEAHREANVMYYDEAAEMLIKRYFDGKTTSNELNHDVDKTLHDASREVVRESHQEAVSDATVETLINLLKRELDTKNAQIEALNEALLNAQRQAEAAQMLHAADKRQLITADGETDADKVRKPFWDRLLGR